MPYKVILFFSAYDANSLIEIFNEVMVEACSGDAGCVRRYDVRLAVGFTHTLVPLLGLEEFDGIPRVQDAGEDF